MGNGPGDLRAFRRRRFARSSPRCWPRPSARRLSCILVDNGLLRKDEAESVIEEFTEPLQDRPARGQGRGQVFSTALAGVTDPQEKRRRIGHAFIECFADEAAQDRRRRVPRPGHALSRRDRERRLARRPGRHDQAAPQRRRTARGPGLRADRAAARPVQGRGPHAGPAAGPAGRHRLAASVPRARAWPSAAWAR